MSTNRRTIRKSSLMFMISIMGITIVFLLAVLIVVFSYFVNKEGDVTTAMSTLEKDGYASYSEEELGELLDKNATQAQQDLLTTIQGRLLGGESTISVFRDLYTDQLIVIDDNRYCFFNIDETLKKHDYDESAFSLSENGELTYSDSTGRVGHKVIDVSRYQENIDWSSVATNGVEYAMIRLGYRGYGSGALVEDEGFDANAENAIANGIGIGVYFVTQATTEAEAIEEADFVLDAIEGYDITYPIAIDIEDVNDDEARTEGLTQEQWTNNCIAFCERIREAGYTPMLYGNLKTYLLMLDMSRLEGYEKWFAYYSEPVYFPYQYAMWQYTESGTVDGISSNVDLNISFYEPKK